MSDRLGFLPYQPCPWPQSRPSPTIPDTVSVIIPAYNAVATIAYALRSCAWQTRRPDEVVVVDDASTDGTGLVTLAWSAQDKPATFGVSRLDCNRGAAAARNAAIRLCSGEFVFYLDADDMMPDGRIADTLDEFYNTGADVIYGQKQWFEHDHTQRKADRRVSEPAPGNIVGGTGFGCGAVAVRRSVHVEDGLWLDESMSVGEDAELLVACVSAGLQVHCSTNVYCWRRKSEGSLRNRGNWGLMRSWLRVKHEAWLDGYGVRPMPLADRGRVLAARREAGWAEI